LEQFRNLPVIFQSDRIEEGTTLGLNYVQTFVEKILLY